MSTYQILALIILAVYYSAYFTKMKGQKKKGIRTTQLGAGNKAKKTVVIERILSKISITIVVVEVVSIVFDDWFKIPESLQMVGIILAISGTVVFIVAMITMQDSWRAGIPASESTELVTSGIYRISRNPAFLGFDLVYIGLGITFFNFLLAVVSVAGVVVMHLQILEEEKFLINVFGEEYKVYKEKVGRYFWSYKN